MLVLQTLAHSRANEILHYFNTPEVLDFDKNPMNKMSLTDLFDVISFGESPRASGRIERYLAEHGIHRPGSEDRTFMVAIGKLASLHAHILNITWITFTPEELDKIRDAIRHLADRTMVECEDRWKKGM